MSDGIRRAVVAATILAAACHRVPREAPSVQETMSKRDINAVLGDHDDELMAIPGVVGVYVGLLDDDQTLCLKVMVVRKTRELEGKIPKTLEGYSVVIEESGVIRPMGGDKPPGF
jgi:hypothetical protein